MALGPRARSSDRHPVSVRGRGGAEPREAILPERKDRFIPVPRPQDAPPECREESPGRAVAAEERGAGVRREH